jgi:hypothetical protein
LTLEAHNIHPHEIVELTLSLAKLGVFRLFGFGLLIPPKDKSRLRLNMYAKELTNEGA